MGQKVLLKDNVVKKILNSEKKECREYLTRIISCATGIDINLLRGNIELVTPEIGSNIYSVNSEADSVYRSDENYFNIEVNYINTKKTVVIVKNNTYLYNLILRQLGSSKDYNKVKKVIQININNYDIFQKKEFVYVSKMMEVTHKKIRDEMIEIIDINLPFLESIDYNNIKKGNDFDLEKLLYIFVCDDKKILDQVYAGDEVMNKVRNDEEIFMNVMDSLLYYNYEDLLTDEEKVEFNKKKEQARKEGRKEGIKEGRKEGRKEGIKEGIEERNLEILKNMLDNGISDEIILKSLNIDIDTLEKLKEILNKKYTKIVE